MTTGARRRHTISDETMHSPAEIRDRRCSVADPLAIQQQVTSKKKAPSSVKSIKSKSDTDSVFDKKEGVAEAGKRDSVKHDEAIGNGVGDNLLKKAEDDSVTHCGNGNASDTNKDSKLLEKTVSHDSSSSESEDDDDGDSHSDSSTKSKNAPTSSQSDDSGDGESDEEDKDYVPASSVVKSDPYLSVLSPGLPKTPTKASFKAMPNTRPAVSPKSPNSSKKKRRASADSKMAGKHGKTMGNECHSCYLYTGLCWTTILVALKDHSDACAFYLPPYHHQLYRLSSSWSKKVYEYIISKIAFLVAILFFFGGGEVTKPCIVKYLELVTWN